MNDKIKTELQEALEAEQPSGADADRSEEQPNIFSNLNSDNDTGYDQLNDPTPESERKRIHDK